MDEKWAHWLEYGKNRKCNHILLKIYNILCNDKEAVAKLGHLELLKAQGHHLNAGYQSPPSLGLETGSQSQGLPFAFFPQEACVCRVRRGGFLHWGMHAELREQFCGVILFFHLHLASGNGIWITRLVQQMPFKRLPPAISTFPLAVFFDYIRKPQTHPMPVGFRAQQNIPWHHDHCWGNRQLPTQQSTLTAQRLSPLRPGHSADALRP